MRRRKPKVVWLPLTNANSIGVDTDAEATVYNGFLIGVVGATGDTQTTSIPLVLDAPQSAISTPNSSIADIQSSGYRLRRIVGKIWCVFDQATPTDASEAPAQKTQTVIVTAGLMVRRVDTLSGAALASLVPGDNSPALNENTSDPWIWRRSWFLGDRFAAGNVSSPAQELFQENRTINEWPQNNFSSYAGGNSDGPHVDAKTARVIAQEERLFLDVSATVLLEGANPLVASNVSCFTDLRVLGSIMTNSGNRRNSSR